MDIKQMSTLEFFEFAAKKPATLFKTAQQHDLEISDYAVRAVKNDGVGPRQLDPFKKLLKKENLPIKRKGAVKLGDFILEETEPSQKRAYYRMLFHETSRREIEETLNYGMAELAEPVNIDHLTQGMDPEVQKLKAGFSVSEHLRDTIMRPTTQRPNEFKEKPRLVVELSDIAMRQTEIGFGGEKQLIILNEAGRFPTPRIAELEEIPRSQIGHEEISESIHKYGIGLEASYEAIAQASDIGYDQLTTYFSQLALYWRMNEVGIGVETMLNLFNTAAVGEDLGLGSKALTPVGASNTSGEITASTKSNPHLGSKTLTGSNNQKHVIDAWSWRNMRKNFPGFAPDYITLNHILGNAHMTTELEMLNLDKTNIPLDRNVGPPISPANPLPSLTTRDGMPYGWISEMRDADNEAYAFPGSHLSSPYSDSDAHGDERLMIYDRNWALMYYVRMQSSISETEAFILNQSRVWTITKAFGFRVYDADGIWMIGLHARPAKVA